MNIPESDWKLLRELTQAGNGQLAGAFNDRLGPF